MTVKVFTQPQCRSCDRVKSKLEEAGIAYEAVDIMQDAEAYTYVKDVLGAKSVPVIVDGLDGVSFGYDPSKLKKLISWYTEKPKLAPCQLYDADIRDYVYSGDDDSK